MLGGYPVFSKLAARQLEAIAQSAIGKTYDSGEFIAHQGETWPYTLLLVEGLVNVQKFSAEGRTLGGWWLASGEVFWSPTIFDGEPLPASLEARKLCRAYLWRQADLLPSVRGNPEATWDLCTSLVERMRKASSMVEDLAFHPVTARVARLLLEQSKGEEKPQFSRSLTLDEMARTIGSTPVMVCKIISSFASEDLIKVSRTEFELVDKEGLEQMAGV
jgi:CRP/FNR family transcriptional regulator